MLREQTIKTKQVAATVGQVSRQVAAIGLVVMTFVLRVPLGYSAQGPLSLSEEVKTLLERKLEDVAALVKNPEVAKVLKMSNLENQSLSEAEILRLDQQWREQEGIGVMMLPYLTNICAGELLDFQEVNPEYVEIFITDRRGLNVCQTNKTSDFYQADEEWWQLAFNAGTGKAYYGSLEYDSSAQSHAISIYVPIRDGKDRSVIGVCKAVVGIGMLKDEL